jgi:hypothetical protein
MIIVAYTLSSCYRAAGPKNIETNSPQGIYRVHFNERKLDVNTHNAWEYKVFLSAYKNGNGLFDNVLWQAGSEDDSNKWGFQKSNLSWKAWCLDTFVTVRARTS